MTEINFYSNFHKFQVKVIGDASTGWVNKNKIPANVSFVDSSLYPVWGFDPWTQVFGNYHAHRSFQFVKNLENLVEDCDILNVSDLFYFYCWQTARIARKTGKKLMAIVWETIPQHITTYLPPYCFGVQAMLSQTDLFVARSKLAKGYLQSIGVADSRIKVIYKGIDLSQFKPRARTHGDRIIILYVGQLVKSKGILDLVSVFARLYKEFPNIELLLLGKSIEDPLEKQIKQQSSYLPITVKIQLDYDKLPSFYQQADIYCQLSQEMNYFGPIKGWNEWFSYAILEAMASGLPVVATDIGGIPEQLGDCGNLLVHQKNENAAYEALKILILNKKMRLEVGHRNRIRAKEQFNIVKQAYRTEQIALSLLK